MLINNMEDYINKFSNNKIENNNSYIFAENGNQTKIFLYNSNSNRLINNVDI